jgi:hypothetical protein
VKAAAIAQLASLSTKYFWGFHSLLSIWLLRFDI